jgi:hypothetical protein
VFWTTVGTSSLDVITIVNGLPDRVGQIPFNSGSQALNWIASSSNYFAVGPDYYAQIDADGLVLYLEGNQVISYPTTGSTWYDLSGYDAKGTLINGTTWNSDGWFIFDGTDDYVNVPDSSNLNLTNQGTISVWINPATVTQDSFSGLASKSTGGSVNQQSYQLSWRQVSNAFFGSICNGSGTYNDLFAPLPTVANVWYNIVFTWNGSQLNMYNNGVVIGTTTQTINNQILATDLTIGGNPYKGAGGGDDTFNGKIANVSLYNKGLSASEVLQNYYGGPIVTNGLVFAVDAGNLASYPKSGTTWYGLTGSLSGSLINGPTFDPANGGSIVFDGTNDFISTNLTQTFINELTVETWYRGTKTTRNHLWNFGSSVADNLHCNFNDSGLSLWVYWQGGGSPAIRYITPNFTDGSIHHLVFRHSGSVNQVYLDGQLLTPYDVLGTQTFTGDGVGGSYNIGGNPEFGGNVYVNRVYNRALSASEILQNYNATK